jgi:hypothetical protein
VGGRGPTEILLLFATSEEAAARRDMLRKHLTYYPHGHFYSPVVDVDDIKTRAESVFERTTPLAVNLAESEQLGLLPKLAPFFTSMPFSDEYSKPYRYYFNNTSYGFGDACIYWGMIGNFRPKRIIEIGSGFTSALAIDAIEHFELETICTFIDPYPNLLLNVVGPMDSRHTIISDQVQNVQPSLVDQLEAGDFLFVDSSHIVKSGSDVHFELTKLLPRVKSGVIVHFHDIFYPFEYPRSWVVDLNYSWNEIYFLQCFLMYNSEFEILYFNDYVSKEHGDLLRELVPHRVAARINLNPGGGLWLRRK